MNKKLRIGLLLDDYQIPAWAHLMLTRLAESDHADIVLIVLNGAKRETPDLIRKVRTRWKTIPSRLVTRCLNFARLRLMERVHCERDAFEKVDLRPLLRDIPVIAVQPVQKKYSDYFVDDDIAKVKDHSIDVLVRLGFRVLRGAILTVSKYGVWSYHHGDYLVNRGGPAGFWEAMESWPETGTVLQILTEELDAGVILYQSWSRTNSRSVTLNNNSRYWTSASFLPRMIDRLGAFGEERFFAEVAQKNLHPSFYSNRLFSRPGNKELTYLLLRKFLEKTKNKILNYFYFDQWCLLFDRNPGIATSLRRFVPVVPPRDRFWADPNVLYRNDSYSIYFEEFIFAQRKGRIALINMDRNGNHDDPVTVIEEPHHLSYPFLFTHDDALYMLAEAYEANAVPLYRCVEYPDKWTFAGNLLENIAAVDPTLLFHNGKWFLFVGVEENRGSSPSDELFLYFSDDPLSNVWTPHPLNPVVSDVRSARPAGRIIERNGTLFRPGQNCSHHYGHGLSLNQIVSLSETEYVEKSVTTIVPRWSKKVTGVHTLTHAHQLTVMDALVRRARHW